MVGTYDVMLGRQKAGRVEVTREGLYYRFSCRCRREGREMLRLWMACGKQEVDLGLCVPMGDGFGTEKRIPVRQCGTGMPEFVLRPKDDILRGNFIPLSPEEPFGYLHRLENAFLERRGEKVGIVLRQMSSSRPTGQWSEPSTSL